MLWTVCGSEAESLAVFLKQSEPEYRLGEDEIYMGIALYDKVMNVEFFQLYTNYLLCVGMFWTYLDGCAVGGMLRMFKCCNWTFCESMIWIFMNSKDLRGVVDTNLC